MKQQARLMISGSIYGNIIRFAFPIFLMTLLQQLYNTVDTLVVGNFIGKEALAAITSSTSLIFLLVGLVQGIFVGAGVVISMYYGKGDVESVKKAIHTTISFSIVSSIVLTIIGYFFAPVILKWMGTPLSVSDEANTYVRVFFLGISALVLYNTAAGILQAVGDSKHPLYFLMIAAFLNIVLDILFVAVLHMGIAGTAFATIISQSVSVFFSFRLLFTTQEIFKVELKKIKFYEGMVRKILQIGFLQEFKIQSLLLLMFSFNQVSIFLELLLWQGPVLL